MQNTYSTNPDGSPKILLGRTMVECYQIDENGEKEVMIKQGVVTQNFGTFLRVYDPRPVSKNGDSHIVGEIMPVMGKRSYTRIVGELKERDAFRVPASFLFRWAVKVKANMKKGWTRIMAYLNNTDGRDALRLCCVSGNRADVTPVSL